jgi:hypothetical protein
LADKLPFSDEFLTSGYRKDIPMLKKIQTEHRSELANDTICSLICAKQYGML